MNKLGNFFFFFFIFLSRRKWCKYIRTCKLAWVVSTSSSSSFHLLIFVLTSFPVVWIHEQVYYWLLYVVDTLLTLLAGGALHLLEQCTHIQTVVVSRFTSVAPLPIRCTYADCGWWSRLLSVGPGTPPIRRAAHPPHNRQRTGALCTYIKSIELVNQIT